MTRIKMKIRGGAEVTGKSPNSIARRVYGRRAFFRPNRNPSSGLAGEILSPVPHDEHVFRVRAEVASIDQEVDG